MSARIALLLIAICSLPLHAVVDRWPWSLAWPRRPPVTCADGMRGAANSVYLAETLFVVPVNDGEAVRAAAILNEVGAPHVHISRQKWGASIDTEWLAAAELRGIRRVVVFEMPGAKGEGYLHAQGLEVVIVDHHGSKAFPDRFHNLSSLEQLAQLIHYPLNEWDRWVATNDRAYVAGLRKLRLDEAQIRQVRNFDLRSQGRTQAAIDQSVLKAQSYIPFLPVQNGVTIYKTETVDPAILQQELAMQSPTGLANFVGLGEAIRFSGEARIVQKLAALDPKSFGMMPNEFQMYHGGDRGGSMFLTLSPRAQGQPLPTKLREAAYDIIFAPASAETKVLPRLPSFETYGNPASPALVLIHGSREDRHTFAAAAQILAKDFYVVAYDLRGFGASSLGLAQFRSPILAEDLKGLLDSLKIDQAHLVAHAEGSKVAVRFAALYPNRARRLVLEDSFLGATLEVTSEENNRFARTLQHMLANNESPINRNSFIFEVQSDREDLCPQLKVIDTTSKILLLRSVGSRFVSLPAVEAMRACAPHLRTVTFNGDPLIHEDLADDYAATVRSFVGAGE